MLSPLDLLDAVLASKQLDMIRKTGSPSRPVGQGSPSFQQVLANSLHASPSVLPFNRVTPEADAKFQEGLKFVLEREGTKHVREDGGRESSRYGILQSTAREYGYRGNIKDLTKADAEAIYRKLWDKSGAASLPFPLSTVHFDTYVNSPSAAEKILAKSQGNTDVYLRLREQRYARLVEIRPEQFGKYLKGWNNRIRYLRTMVAQHMHGASFKV
jgi:lysozyme family protein